MFFMMYNIILRFHLSKLNVRKWQNLPRFQLKNNKRRILIRRIMNGKYYVEAKANTGLEMNLLQKYIFIPLDIFRKTRHNKNIDNKMDARLTFFSTDDPEEIVKLITAYPEFKPLYEDVYQLCLNTEKVMGMFSKELQILDENTV